MGQTTDLELGPTAEDPLRRATPASDDVQARHARSMIEQRLFGGAPPRVQLGRYHVRGRIGAGGFGVVYRAHDPELARDVAVKVLNTEAVDPAQADVARARLVREGRAMARLADPHVIHVYDVGTVEDGVFIAMELVEGESLAKWLIKHREEKGPWTRILRTCIEAGRGLAAAHAAGVIHRDFKPENVLVGKDGRVRVGDFGLAGDPSKESLTGPHRALDRAHLDRANVNETLTRTGTLLGTPKYMAPEQEDGRAADERCDQFGFCVTLYEALYGVPPFAGDTIASYRHNVHEGNISSPPASSPVPARVHAAIVRGLAVDPRQRHESMQALLEQLDEASAPGPSRWRGRPAVFATAIVAGSLVAGYVGWSQLARDAPAVAAADTGSSVAPASELPASTPAQHSDSNAAASDARARDETGTPSAGTRSAAAASQAPSGARTPDSVRPTKTPPADKSSGGGEPSPSGLSSRRARAKAVGGKSSYCYFLGDQYTYLGSHRKRLRKLELGGQCYDECRPTEAPAAIAGDTSCTKKYRCSPCSK